LQQEIEDCEAKIMYYKEPVVLLKAGKMLKQQRKELQQHLLLGNKY
jgi:hypothetical protein